MLFIVYDVGGFFERVSYSCGILLKWIYVIATTKNFNNIFIPAMPIILGIEMLLKSVNFFVKLAEFQ